MSRGIVSAGALWVSGTDAFGPKPCLIPESSSSDEGLFYFLQLHVYIIL